MTHPRPISRRSALLPDAEDGIDIVIVTHNNATTIGPCIEAARSGTTIPAHILVVDSSSTDATASVVAATGTELVLSGNRGFGAGCNLGASHGRAPFLLFLNPDTYLAPDALASLVDTIVRLDARGVEAAIGPVFNGVPPWRDEHFRKWLFPSQLAVAKRILRTRTCVPRSVGPGLVLLRPQTLSGAALLVRRRTFEFLGGFDERFFLYCEDGDFCRRARRAGVTLWVQPDARVSHVVGHSSRGLGDLSAIQAESNMWLVRKHYGRLAALLCALDLGITTLAFGAIEAFRGDDQALRRRMRRIRALRHPFTPPRRRVMQPQSFLSATSAGGRVQLQPDGVTPLGEGRR